MSGTIDQYSNLQGAGLTAGLVPGQTVTQTAHTQRSTEFHNPSHTFGVPNASSSSFQDYRVTSSIAESALDGGAPTYQHHTASSNYGYSGAPVPAPITYQSTVTNVVTPPQRQPRYRKQVVRLPDQAPVTRQVRRRVRTPEPDTLERVFHQRVAAEVIEEITEIPMTPPPIVRERTVVEPSGPPQVIRRTVRVPPRGAAYGGYPQYNSPAPAYSPYPASYGAYGAPSANVGGYGSYAYPQQRPIWGNCPCAGVPGAVPVAGARGASCFYV